MSENSPYEQKKLDTTSEILYTLHHWVEEAHRAEVWLSWEAFRRCGDLRAGCKAMTVVEVKLRANM